MSDMDVLIAEYNRLFESTHDIGDAVVYEKETWYALKEAFTNIIDAIDRR